MDIELKSPHKIKLIHETLLLRHRVEFEIDRPIQAWQWMNQTRSVPEQHDWVRPEVRDAWERCLDDYHLPLGHYANWDDYPIIAAPVEQANPATHIKELIKHLSNNFHTALQDAGMMMVLTTADGRLLYALGEQKLPNTFMTQMHLAGSVWSESVLGNNGIGTTAILKKPVAFQGMEHFLNVLHPFTTVGYPLLNEAGELIAIIGLISDYQESMNSLFAFLHLICVLVNTNLPLAQNTAAQERVLEKIHFNPAKKIPLPLNNSEISTELDALIKKAVKLQHYKVPILITGESGVGKDHFVRLLREAGPRKDAPLIAINCASIPRDLIESELFGYESGSFTGAKSSGKLGKFMLADKGILFLDEIGDMSFDLQSTLLRVLETSEFMPVGGNKSIHVDVQVVAATNVKLLEAVEAGRFRRDLYYRLNGAQIHLLPLRDRPDKKSIIHHILQREMNTIADDGRLQISPEVISLIEQHPWPGNIRQLINVIRSTFYTASGSVINLQDLPIDFVAEIQQFNLGNTHFVNPRIDESVSMSLTDWEFYGIKTTLKNCGGNISLAAKKLGVTRTTLYKKMERFGLNREGVVTCGLKNA
ncbi:sigma-54-dependent Fis family transcriptional regulator [Crenothrix sp. D3]|nr:sigma-54-dependent Fis family transcriptional regulator [Crenothrix sp. D3]